MIKIIIAGDFCPNERIGKRIKNHQLDYVFGSVKPIIGSADYSVVNFECPVLLKDGQSIQKTGPVLKTNVDAVKATKFAGFNMATLANNHFYDCGERGVRDTLTTCEEFGIDTVGGGKNLDHACRIFYKEIKKKRVAFINFCETEFSIATETKGGSSPLDPVKNYHQISEAKIRAEFVIVIVHGGHEYYQLPSLRMKETYRFFVEAGADAVINHHQHCFSGYEIYKGKPIFYGIGNFCFDSKKYRDHIWNEGFLVELVLDDSKSSFNLHPYVQCNHKAKVIPLDEKEEEKFRCKLSKLNRVIANDDELEKNHKKFLANKTNYVKMIFEPYQGRLLSSLYRRGLLPSFLNLNRLKILACVQNESLRERLIYILKNLN